DGLAAGDPRPPHRALRGDRRHGTRRAAGGPRARPAGTRRPGGGRDGRHRGERLHRPAADDGAGRQGGDGAPGRPAPHRARRGGASTAGGGAGDGRAGGPRQLRRRGQGGAMSGAAGKLAVDGGTPVRQTPLLPGWPGGLLIGEAEKAQVLEVLESQSLYRHYGPRPLRKVAELEQGFARAMEVRHALAVTSGTGALIVGLAALGIGPGDEVIVPTYTWVATINAVVMLGAVPVFVDIDESLTMDPRAVEAAITPSTAAILPVHMRGAAADMAGIMAVAHPPGALVDVGGPPGVGGLLPGRAGGAVG